MEVVKEMKIQSYAVLFGGFRVASKIPKVITQIILKRFWLVDIFWHLTFKWVLGKSVEKMIRESPPECLVDPELGRHLYVKINVRDECSLIHIHSIILFLGLQIPLCWKRISEEHPSHLSPRFYWFLVWVEKSIKRAVKIILGCGTWFKGIRGLWETLFIPELFRWRHPWGNKEVCWHHSREKEEDCSFGTWSRRSNWMETCRKVPRDGF